MLVNRCDDQIRAFYLFVFTGRAVITPFSRDPSRTFDKMFGESEEAEDTYLVTISERIQGTSLPGTGRELRRSFM